MAKLENATTKKETLTIKMPLSKAEKEDIFVSINGRITQIKRGHSVDVSRDVADIIAQSESMALNSFEYEQKVAENANKV